jgi:hypothetical protein
MTTAVTLFAHTPPTRQPHATRKARIAYAYVVWTRDSKSGALRSHGSQPSRGAVSPTSECCRSEHAPADSPRTCSDHHSDPVGKRKGFSRARLPHSILCIGSNSARPPLRALKSAPTNRRGVKWPIDLPAGISRSMETIFHRCNFITHHRRQVVTDFFPSNHRRDFAMSAETHGSIVDGNSAGREDHKGPTRWSFASGERRQ